MGVASLGLLAPAAGALLQEGIDIASIVNALRASRALPNADLAGGTPALATAENFG